MPQIDPEKFRDLLATVKKFTDTEVLFLVKWLEAALLNKPVAAFNIVATGTLLKHWQSVMPETPADIPEEMLFAEKLFKDLFDKALAEFEAQKPTKIEGIDRRIIDRMADGVAAQLGYYRGGGVAGR